jgi:hypothetical protein
MKNVVKHIRPNPITGVAHEPDAAIGVEFPERVHQPEATLGDQLADCNAIASVSGRQRKHVAKMSADQTLARCAILMLTPPVNEYCLFMVRELAIRARSRRVGV